MIKLRKIVSINLILILLFILSSNCLNSVYATITDKNSKVVEERKKITFDKTIGINAFIDDPLEIMSVAGTIREYHNFSWTLDKANENKFNPSYVSVWNFDSYYKKLYEAGITVMPCIQGTSKAVVNNMSSRSQKPINDGEDSTNPESYKEHASTMFQYAARYGSNNVDEDKLLLANDQEKISGLGYIEYYENWNEPDKTWEGAKSYFSPEEMAAMCSADYDGHEGALGDTYGIKNADSNAKLVMGGVCNNSNYTKYLDGMKAWAEENRTDKELPVDVLNFHMYVGKNCPENSEFEQRCKEVTTWRDENAKGREVWLTEFGWDTNINSQLGASQQNQRDWLIRTYLIANASGIDRSTMYMVRDAGNQSDSGKYSTSGLTTKKGEWTKKASWYGVYTLKNTLNGFIFKEIVKQEDNIYIYKFVNEENKEECYVLWSPTENGSHIDNYKLNVENYEKASITTLQDKSIEGETSSLPINGGEVIVNVTETPIFVKVSEPKVIEEKIVKGDLDGDGIISINDLAKMKLHIIDKEKLTGNNLIAGDLDDDNEITINDLVLMKLVLIGIRKI